MKFFETWNQKIIVLLDKFTETKGEKSQLESTKQTHTTNSDNKIQVLYHELVLITAIKYLLWNPIYPQAMIFSFKTQCAPRRQEITRNRGTLKTSKN